MSDFIVRPLFFRRVSSFRHESKTDFGKYVIDKVVTNGAEKFNMSYYGYWGAIKKPEWAMLTKEKCIRLAMEHYSELIISNLNLKELNLLL